MGFEIVDKGVNSQISVAEDVQANGARVVVHGSNNTVRIGAGCNIGSALIEIRNHDSLIEIGSDCVINGQYRCRATGTQLRIGKKTTIMNALITLHEAGKITIGEDCMFSGDVQMDVSDMHSILDVNTGARINPADDIDICDHVWLGQGARVQKGVRIGAHSIIGSRAVVTSDIPENALAVGVPARVIREGVTWDRRRL